MIVKPLFRLISWESLVNGCAVCCLVASAVGTVAAAWALAGAVSPADAAVPDNTGAHVVAAAATPSLAPPSKEGPIVGANIAPPLPDYNGTPIVVAPCPAWKHTKFCR